MQPKVPWGIPARGAVADRRKPQYSIMTWSASYLFRGMKMVDKDATPAAAESIEILDAEPMKREFIKLDALPIVLVPISSLQLDTSPRHGGENDEHTRLLAESEQQLPPIVVHGPSMRVIDGIHRVRAAILRGEQAIAAKIYQGTDDDAFLLAVRLNIAHGMPLTRAERTAAAVRIIGCHPHWSDGMIATTVGLSPRTVAKARHRSTPQTRESTTRLGQDGRVRPIDPAAGRLRVAALLADNPSSPIRTIAHQAGVSSSTVHDVRQRLRAGQPPTPRSPDRSASDARPRTAPDRASADRAEITAIFAELKKDVAQQAGKAPRSLLRCLDRYHLNIPGANKIIEMVSPRWASSVSRLAREYARIWTHIAAQLEQHATLTTHPTIPQQATPASPEQTGHEKSKTTTEKAPTTDS